MNKQLNSLPQQHLSCAGGLCQTYKHHSDGPTNGLGPLLKFELSLKHYTFFIWTHFLCSMWIKSVRGDAVEAGREQAQLLAGIIDTAAPLTAVRRCLFLSPAAPLVSQKVTAFKGDLPSSITVLFRTWNRVTILINWPTYHVLCRRVTLHMQR